MNIPQGYKSSPLGIIPKDWEVKRLGEVCRFLQTNTYSRAQMCDKGGEVNNIHYGDILTKYRSILDVRKTCIPFLLEENNVCNVLLQNGDIVMADTAEDEMVGKVCEIFGITKEKVVAGLHTIALRPQSKMFAACYLGYYMDSTCFHSRLIPYMQGIKVYSLTKSVIENSIIPLPPLAEQERIAELLGTWDRAIEMQKQLIDKLELRKKGLMQQLLTGKKRLPGFTGEWKEIVLKDISNITIGEFVHKKFQNPNGKYPVYNGGITETGYYDYSNQKGGQIVISARGAGGGFINKVDCDYWAGNSSYSVDVNNAHFDWIYVYLYMKSKQSILDGNKQQGGGVPSVNKSQVENFIIKYPPTKEEQSAIAHVFSALDYEIQKLTEKRDKYIEEKQGLMQVLLTGKKRI